MSSLELAAGSFRVKHAASYAVAPKRPGAALRRGRAAGTSAWAAPVGPTSEVPAALLDAVAVQTTGMSLPSRRAPVAKPADSRAGRLMGTSNDLVPTPHRWRPFTAIRRRVRRLVRQLA